MEHDPQMWTGRRPPGRDPLGTLIACGLVCIAVISAGLGTYAEVTGGKCMPVLWTLATAAISSLIVVFQGEGPPRNRGGPRRD